MARAIKSSAGGVRGEVRREERVSSEETKSLKAERIVGKAVSNGRGDSMEKEDRGRRIRHRKWSKEMRSVLKYFQVR
jgi:hypothetical protein